MSRHRSHREADSERAGRGGAAGDGCSAACEPQSSTRSSARSRADKPAEILGVAAGAAPEEVRAAYLQRVKEHPPERSPEMFEQIRDAYQVLSEPYRRAEELLLRDEPAAPLVDLLEESCAERRHVGPGPWLAVLRKEPGSTS